MGPVNSSQDLLTNVFFSPGRDILATVAVSLTDYKHQTQNVEYFSSIQTLTKSLTMIPWTEMNNGVNRKLLGSNLHRNLFSNCQLATLISPLFSRMLSSSFFRWIETNREGDLSFFRMLSSSLQSRKNVFLIKKEKRKEKKKYLTLWNKN